MRIVLDKIGKQYKEEWIFQNINFEFQSGGFFAILGSNGSGKSTLLNIISSHMMPTVGNVRYFNHSKEIPQEEIFRNISVCSPYIELIEEFTLIENIEFFCSFKKLLKGITTKDLIDITYLRKTETKTLQQFSSGMLQRVKLALAILSDVPVVFLDEPCSNLDAEGIEWYNTIILKYSESRLFIVSSNDQKHEYEFCTKELRLNHVN